MDFQLPSWTIPVIRETSVDRVRKSFIDLKNSGSSLVKMDLLSLAPTLSPETRARMGVFIFQISTFSSSGAIVSFSRSISAVDKEWNENKEQIRISILEQIVQRRFEWIELEGDIPFQVLSKLAARAKTNGSKVLLSFQLENMKEWEPPSMDKLSFCDGIKIVVPVHNPTAFKRWVRTAEMARSIFPRGMRIIQPSGPEVALLLAIAPMIDGGCVELPVGGRSPISKGEQDSSEEKPGTPQVHIWKEIGLVGPNVKKNWSMAGRVLKEDTDFCIQVGRSPKIPYNILINNTLYKTSGKGMVTLPFNIDQSAIGSFISSLQQLPVKGLAIEMPLRSIMIKFMDWIDPRSKIVGSINIAMCKEKKLYGYNTEVYGIADLLSQHLMVRDQRVLVIGTGTGGRAAAVGARMLGLKTYLAGSSLERTKQMASKMGMGIKGVSYKALRKPKLEYGVLINSLPGGEGSELIPGEIARKVEPELGIEMNTSAPWTPFLAGVESRGGKALQGMELMVKTAVRNISIWTGAPISEDEVRDVLEKL